MLPIDNQYPAGEFFNSIDPEPALGANVQWL